MAARRPATPDPDHGVIGAMSFDGSSHDEGQCRVVYGSTKELQE